MPLEFFCLGLLPLYPVSSPPDLSYYRFLETLFVATLRPQHAYVTLYVKRDKLELAFWLLCSMHAVIQVPPDGVVGSQTVVAIPLQPALLM